MIRCCVALVTIVVFSSGSIAASTPPRANPPPRTETSRPCTIGSFKGVMLPGSTVCVKVGGFVRYQAATGGAIPVARP